MSGARNRSGGGTDLDDESGGVRAGAVLRTSPRADEIGRERALDIAQRHAAEQGWPWHEPVSVELERPWLRRPRWQIISNAGCRGSNVFVTIDARTGVIRNAGFGPR